MGIDKNWPEQCTVTLCHDPYLRPHHHHMYPVTNGINPYPCTCGNVDQPGTRPKDK